MSSLIADSRIITFVHVGTLECEVLGFYTIDLIEYQGRYQRSIQTGVDLNIGVPDLGSLILGTNT